MKMEILFRDGNEQECQYPKIGDFIVDVLQIIEELAVLAQ